MSFVLWCKSIRDSELGISMQSRRKFKSVHLVFEDIEPTHSRFSTKGPHQVLGLKVNGELSNVERLQVRDAN